MLTNFCHSKNKRRESNRYIVREHGILLDFSCADLTPVRLLNLVSIAKTYEREDKRITSLDLSFNEFSEADLLSLINIAKIIPSLEEFAFNAVGLGDKHAKYLPHIVNAFPNLKKVEILGNLISEKVLYSVISQLNNKKLIIMSRHPEFQADFEIDNRSFLRSKSAK